MQAFNWNPGIGSQPFHPSVGAKGGIGNCLFISSTISAVVPSPSLGAQSGGNVAAYGGLAGQVSLLNNQVGSQGLVGFLGINGFVNNSPAPSGSGGGSGIGTLGVTAQSIAVVTLSDGGNTLTSCTAAATAGSSPLASDFNCTGGLVWTATDGTGITADCAQLYNSTTTHAMAFYTFTSAAATGNGATFTITPPTVSASVRGMMYVAKGLTMEELQALQSLGWIPKDLPATAMIMLQVYGGRF